MKRKSILKIALILFIAITKVQSFGQTTIYLENFTDQENKGAVGPPTTLDLAGVDWTIDISDLTLADDSDWFKVTNGVFEARDIDGKGIWLSESITISGYTDVSFSLSATEDGVMEESDIFKTEYKIDESDWVIATTNGDLNDDFNTLTVSQTGLSGTTLQIRVTMSNAVGVEYHRLDDILVEGTLATSDPTITFNKSTSSETETNLTFATSGIPITLTNYNAEVSVTASINENSTAEAADYTIDLTTLVFNTNETLLIPLSIHNDADNENETLIVDISITSGTANLGISQHTITIIDDDLPNIIINEILASPGTSTTLGDPNFGDANGDGLRPNHSEDEFIELVNLEPTTLDIGGYTISEDNGIVHTFAQPTNLTAGGSIVVFGGGTPTNIPGLAVTSSTGNLSLLNGGETITLKNSEGITVTTVTYLSLTNQSFARHPDLSGDGVGHNTIASNSVNFSPGRYNTTGEPFSTNTWTGTTNSNWSEANNWSLGTVPGSADDIQIIKAPYQPTTSEAVSVNSVTIASGATLISTSAFIGNVTYHRALKNGGQWYLMSSPVIGETFDAAWATSNSLPTSSLDTDNIGMSYYDNTSLDADDDSDGPDTATGHWRYLQTDNSNSVDFSGVGQGYSIMRSESGTISFSGTGMYTTSQTSGVTQGASTNYNLVGNPFTANLNLGDFFADNGASVISGATAWFWNGSTYDTKMAGLDGSFEIAPAQGFFVEAAANTNVTFDVADLTHQVTETFQKNSQPQIQLFVSDGTNNRYAKMYYIDGTTEGYDVGYDGKLFGGITHNFAIFSHLVAHDQGVKYQVQSLPNKDYENMVVPIGIIASAGKEITFTADALNLPEDIMVFLEDKETNTFTRLDEANASYKINLTAALNDIGRFYLHTKSRGTLHTNAITLKNVSVYTPTKNTLRIVGLTQGETSVKLFTLLGKQILNTSFLTHGVSDISIPNVTAGIYLVQIQNEQGKLHKKITLE